MRMLLKVSIPVEAVTRLLEVEVWDRRSNELSMI